MPPFLILKRNKMRCQCQVTDYFVLHATTARKYFFIDVLNILDLSHIEWEIFSNFNLYDEFSKS